MFFVRFYDTFPTRFRDVLADLSYHRMPEWNDMQQICLQLMFLVFFTYMIYRMVRPLFKHIIAWKRQ